MLGYKNVKDTLLLVFKVHKYNYDIKCWPHHQLALSQQTVVPSRLLLKFELLERETELTYHLIYVFRGIYHERQVHVRNSSVTQNE